MEDSVTEDWVKAGRRFGNGSGNIVQKNAWKIFLPYTGEKFLGVFAYTCYKF